MSNSIYKFIIGVLVSSLILGFIFYKRSESENAKQRTEYQKSLGKENKVKVIDLQNQILEGKRKADSVGQSYLNSINKYNILKQKLKAYENIRYYDDIDSDAADSIISVSNYRYHKKDNNSK